MSDDPDVEVPEPHRSFLRRCLDVLGADPRLVGVAAGGSLVAGSMDEFSDLDLVIAVEPADHARVMADRVRIAASLGPLLASFPGEHVGEPRLLICLYGAPLLHVDLKFVALPDVAQRVEDPAVLWERDGRLTRALRQGNAAYPAPDPQCIEDRFWVWVHYAAARLGRGEIFEAIECLSFLRVGVLGPLGLQRRGVRPTGVRRIERLAPEFARELRRTVSGYGRDDCLAALRAAVDLYRSLRGAGIEQRTDAERAAMQYLADVERAGRTA